MLALAKRTLFDPSGAAGLQDVSLAVVTHFHFARSAISIRLAVAKCRSAPQTLTERRCSASISVNQTGVKPVTSVVEVLYKRSQTLAAALFSFALSFLFECVKLIVQSALKRNPAGSHREVFALRDTIVAFYAA